MADMLDNIYETYTPPKGSGNFFSLKDGESARIRIMSQPYVYQDSYKPETPEARISTRYAWLIYNFEAEKAQILKQSGTFFSGLAALMKDPDFGKDPTKHDIRVTRTGTGTDTVYAINLTKTDSEITTEVLEAVANLDLLKDSKESVIMPLTDFVAAGSEFPATPEVRDL